MTETVSDGAEGLKIERITEDAFRAFARRHGSSTEIGPIGTYLDDDHQGQAYGEPHLFGLTGCGEICAIVCCTVGADHTGRSHACKLDSIIVHNDLRRGGLGAALVYKAFQELLDDPRFNVASIYSYAVHPATVRMLHRLGFSDPPPTGAPLSSIEVIGSRRERLAKTLKIGFQNAEKKLKIQCSFCQNNDKRTRRWCAFRLR